MIYFNLINWYICCVYQLFWLYNLLKCYYYVKSLSLQSCLFIAVFRKPSWKDGTTATVVVVVNETVFIAWLGDSQVSKTDHDGMQLNTSYSHGEKTRVDALCIFILLFWTFPNVLKYTVISDITMQASVVDSIALTHTCRNLCGNKH